MMTIRFKGIFSYIIVAPALAFSTLLLKMGIIRMMKVSNEDQLQLATFRSLV